MSDNNSKFEILLSDNKDYSIISLDFLDYNFDIFLLILPILSGILLLILHDLHSNIFFFDPIFIMISEIL